MSLGKARYMAIQNRNVVLIDKVVSFLCMLWIR